MKSIIITSILLLCCAAHAEENKPIVKIGDIYEFSTGSTEVRGKVISNEGNGWYIIETHPTIQIAVNTNIAFTIKKRPDLKK